MDPPCTLCDLVTSRHDPAGLGYPRQRCEAQGVGAEHTEQRDPQAQASEATRLKLSGPSMFSSGYTLKTGPCGSRLEQALKTRTCVCYCEGPPLTPTQG